MCCGEWPPAVPTGTPRRPCRGSASTRAAAPAAAAAAAARPAGGAAVAGQWLPLRCAVAVLARVWAAGLLPLACRRPCLLRWLLYSAGGGCACAALRRRATLAVACGLARALLRHAQAAVACGLAWRWRSGCLCTGAVWLIPRSRGVPRACWLSGGRCCCQCCSGDCPRPCRLLCLWGTGAAQPCGWEDARRGCRVVRAAAVATAPAPAAAGLPVLGSSAANAPASASAGPVQGS